MSSAERCLAATQLYFSFFIGCRQFQRRVDADRAIPVERVHRIVQRNLLVVHNVLEIPAHDHLAFGDTGQRDVQRVVAPLGTEYAGIDVCAMQCEGIGGDFNYLIRSVSPSHTPNITDSGPKVNWRI